MDDPFDPNSGDPDPDVEDYTTEADLDQASSAGLLAVDEDQDSSLERITVSDVDGSMTTLEDRDGSGPYDTALDHDAGGRPDAVAVDLTGDGIPDIVQGDADLEGAPDSIKLPGVEVGLFPEGQVEHVSPSVADSMAPVTPDPVIMLPLTEAQNAAPADDIHGDADREAIYWEEQSENGFCVPVSVGMIVEEVTGRDVPEAELVQTALDAGLLVGEPGAWQGMTAGGAVALLDQYGIEAEAAPNGTLDDLEAYLDEGRNIIVAVDSDEFWHGQDDDATDLGLAADHAVVLTEIDEKRGVVVFNDPGQQEGRAFTIPIERFEEAWSDSQHAMVVAPPGSVAPGWEMEPGIERPGEGLPKPGEPAEPGFEFPSVWKPAVPAFVLLPIVLALRRGASREA